MTKSVIKILEMTKMALNMIYRSLCILLIVKLKIDIMKKQVSLKITVMLGNQLLKVLLMVEV